MSSSALKIIAAVMVLLAVVLGAITVKVYNQNSQRAQQAVARAEEQQKSAPQILAVVAAQPLAAYQPIAREAVALVPVAVAPASYYTTLDEVVGKLPLVDVEAGSPLTARIFKEGNVLARTIPPGHEAVSVEINDVIAVGGFLRPGDIVDVLLFLRGGAGVEQPQARVLLRAARLLAYEERIIDPPEGAKAEGAEQKSRRTRTAVLAVPSADTTRLMLGASLGELRLALKGATDGADPATAAAPAGDKPFTVADLSRAAAAQAAKPAPRKSEPAPSVEIYRGAQRERVVTSN